MENKTYTDLQERLWNRTGRTVEEEIEFMKNGMVNGVDGGFEFEKYCKELLEDNDFYDVYVTPKDNDHGGDIIAKYGDDISFVFQCKYYQNAVGNASVQQVLTAKTIYKKDVAVVMTNSFFSEAAKRDAECAGVKLWDRSKMVELIRRKITLVEIKNAYEAHLIRKNNDTKE